MVSNRRRWLYVALVVVVAVGPLAVQATAPVVKQEPPLSREMKVIINSLRQGALTDPGPDDGKDQYVVMIFVDVTDPRNPAPVGHEYYLSTLDEKEVRLGLLSCGELERVWYGLLATVSELPNCPITAGCACGDVSLFFSRKTSAAARGRCAERIIRILIDHEVQRRQLADSLPPLREV